MASERTDGFLRYERSTREYGIQPKVLGMDQPWRGGFMEHPGGGYKINLLLEALEPHKDDESKIAIFTDRYFFSNTYFKAKNIFSIFSNIYIYYA